MSGRYRRNYRKRARYGQAGYTAVQRRVMGTALATSAGRREWKARRMQVPTISALSAVGYGLPDRMLVRVRFTDVITNTTASGAYSELFYRIIGPYDPRVAAGGDYPAYYAQLTALYQYQQVLRSKIQIWFLPEGSDILASQCEAVLYPSTTATGVTTMNDAIDKRGSKFTSVSIYQPLKTSYLQHVAEPHKLLGMSRRQYRSDDTTRSLSAAVPSRILYWAIGLQNNGTTTNAVQLRIRITYTLELQSLVPVDTQDSAND